MDFVLRELQQARDFDVVVIMAGGNDLSTGVTLPQFEAAYSNIEYAARRANIKSVVVASIWPREDGHFNRLARRHSEFFSNIWYQHDLFTFWHWDRRQAFRTYDGVHLERRGYRKATRYLVAPILWALKHVADVGGIP